MTQTILGYIVFGTMGLLGVVIVGGILYYVFKPTRGTNELTA